MLHHRRRDCVDTVTKSHATPTISVVVPTLNEAENLPHLVRRIDRALRGVSHEIVIVDDASIDGTAAIADTLALARRDTRVIHRDAFERGLSSAILAGFDAARGRSVAVIDADLQHDPAVLPRLLGSLDHADIAIGSRYTFEGRTCGWSWIREIQSRAAATVTRAALALSVRDPLSGCFAISRAAYESLRADLRPRGWKLLLDILAAGRGISVAEVPMTFRARVRGTTKMNAAVLRAWLDQLLDLRRRRVGRSALEPAGATP